MKSQLLIVTSSLMVLVLAAHAQPAPKSASAPAAALTLPSIRVVKTGPENTVRHIDGKELLAAMNSKKPTDVLTEVLLSDDEHHRVSNVLRDKDGLVEFHDTWYDYIFVQAGEGSFVTGGKMVGALDSGPGEKRAKSIVGGKTTNLHAGDYFLVPPMTPHQMFVAKGQQLRYIVFKFRK